MRHLMNKPGLVAITLSTLLLLTPPAPAAERPADTGQAAEGFDAFSDWLDAIRADAVRQGISPATLDAVLSGLSPDDRVIRLDRNQPEFRKTFSAYLRGTISAARIRKARALAKTQRAVFDKARKDYGVQRRFLLALWGIETDFGRNTGSFPVINSVATLAWDGRRSAYFTRELLDALRLVDGGAFAPDDMTGSWAGAMGHFQFMPSVARRYWIDHDGNGRADLWNDPEEAILSAAYYLSSMGWKRDQTWGREVRLPKGFDRALAGRKIRKTLPEWQALGVRRADGSDLPRRPLRASVVLPEKNGRAYVVYDNYRLILSWNYSDFFALSVGLLSDRIGGR